MSISKKANGTSENNFINKNSENFIFQEYNIEILETYTKKLFETYTDEIYDDINYFRSDLTRHLIVLKCIEYYTGHKDLTFEKLVDYIPDNRGSRSHKINCINELCNKGILQRIENSKDKRSTIIQPTDKILKLYSKLHFEYKKILYNFKNLLPIFLLFFFFFDF